jgi:hypothetical protein
MTLRLGGGAFVGSDASHGRTGHDWWQRCAARRGSARVCAAPAYPRNCAIGRRASAASEPLLVHFPRGADVNRPQPALVGMSFARQHMHAIACIAHQPIPALLMHAKSCMRLGDRNVLDRTCSIERARSNVLDRTCSIEACSIEACSIEACSIEACSTTRARRRACPAAPASTSRRASCPEGGARSSQTSPSRRVGRGSHNRDFAGARSCCARRRRGARSCR